MTSLNAALQSLAQRPADDRSTGIGRSSAGCRCRLMPRSSGAGECRRRADGRPPGPAIGRMNRIKGGKSLLHSGLIHRWVGLRLGCLEGRFIPNFGPTMRLEEGLHHAEAR